MHITCPLVAWKLLKILPAITNGDEYHCNPFMLPAFKTVWQFWWYVYSSNKSNIWKRYLMENCSSEVHLLHSFEYFVNYAVMTRSARKWMWGECEHCVTWDCIIQIFILIYFSLSLSLLTGVPWENPPTCHRHCTLPAQGLKEWKQKYPRGGCQRNYAGHWFWWVPLRSISRRPIPSIRLLFDARC